MRLSGKLEESAPPASPVKEDSQSDKSTEAKLNIEESKLVEKKISIFGAKREKENKIDIFANSKSVNLFNLPPSSAVTGAVNIFKMAASSDPSVPNATEDDPSLSTFTPDNSTLEQVMSEPTEKIMKYDYEQRTVKLGEFKLARFKSGQNATKEGALLSLEREKNNSNSAVYFILRSEITKVAVYEAFLLSKTEPEHFMDREENWKLWVLHARKKDGKLTPERELVKLQFETKEEAQRFNEIVRGTEASKQE